MKRQVNKGGPYSVILHYNTSMNPPCGKLQDKTWFLQGNSTSQIISTLEQKKGKSDHQLSKLKRFNTTIKRPANKRP